MACYRILLWFFAYFIVVIDSYGILNAPVTWEIEPNKPLAICDLRKCRVPWTHYESLKCEAIYGYNDNCCPYRYDCDHLYARIGKRHNTCYINGQEYALGEKLKKNNTVLCEQDCTCVIKHGFADFECKIQKKCRPYRLSRHGCYQHNPIYECCRNEEICPDDTRKKAMCKRKTRMTSFYGLIWYKNLFYTHGEYIITDDLLEQKKIILCQENRTDVTTAWNHSTDYSLWYDLHAAAGFYRNCAPVYQLHEQGFRGIQRKTWRCQRSGDDVHVTHPRRDYNVYHGVLSAMHCAGSKHCAGLPKGNEIREETCRIINPEGPQTITYDFAYKLMCIFGQMTMHIGDTLNRVPYDDNSCIVCSCEKPPVPTCILHQYACNMYAHCSARDIIDSKCDPRSFYHVWQITKGFKF